MLGKANQPQVIDRKIWLTVNEAAKLSRYSKDYIRRLAREDALLSLKIGPILLIERQSLADYKSGYTASPQNRTDKPRLQPTHEAFHGLTFEQWLSMSEKQRSAQRSTQQQTLRELHQVFGVPALREGTSETIYDTYDILAALEANGRTNIASESFTVRT